VPNNLQVSINAKKLWKSRTATVLTLVIDCDKSSGQVIDLSNLCGQIIKVDNLSGRLIAVDDYSVIQLWFPASVKKNLFCCLI